MNKLDTNAVEHFARTISQHPAWITEKVVFALVSQQDKESDAIVAAFYTEIDAFRGYTCPHNYVQDNKLPSRRSCSFCGHYELNT